MQARASAGPGRSELAVEAADEAARDTAFRAVRHILANGWMLRALAQSAQT